MDGGSAGGSLASMAPGVSGAAPREEVEGRGLRRLSLVERRARRWEEARRRRCKRSACGRRGCGRDRDMREKEGEWDWVWAGGRGGGC